MADQLTIDAGATRLRVVGLRTSLRQLERAGASATDMRDAMARIGATVARAAVPRAPRVTGRLAGSIRPGRGKTKAVIRAGGARVPYAGVRHYGWPARGIAPAPFLLDALSSTRTAVVRQLDTELGRLLDRHDL